jgi:hypothetical protein
MYAIFVEGSARALCRSEVYVGVRSDTQLCGRSANLVCDVVGSAQRSGAVEMEWVRVTARKKFGISYCGSVTTAVRDLCTGGTKFEGRGLETQSVRRGRWPLVPALNTGR